MLISQMSKTVILIFLHAKRLTETHGLAEIKADIVLVINMIIMLNSYCV